MLGVIQGLGFEGVYSAQGGATSLHTAIKNAENRKCRGLSTIPELARRFHKCGWKFSEISGSLFGGSPQWCIGSPYIYGNYHGSLLLPKQIRTTYETCIVSSDYFARACGKL